MFDLSPMKMDSEGCLKLSDIDTDDTGKFKNKDEAEELLQKNIEKMVEP